MATNSKWLIANSPWLVALFCVCALSAQAQSNLDYRRNSLAMMLVFHPEDEFGEEIYKAFDSLPIPDKYDDHNIGWRVIDNSQIWGVQRRDSGYYKATYGHQLTPSELKANALFTEQLFNEAEVAKEMVAKWFGMSGSSAEDAVFNTDLIQQRGQYNANDVDVALALQTTRGLATLSDAGEELLMNTFVLVNDITYITAEQEAAAAKVAMGVIGGLFDAITGGSAGKEVANVAGDIADSFTGFKVKTHSYLYQLEWNDSIAAIFYQQHYTAKPDPKKIQAFLDDKTTYRLKYVAHEYEFDKKSVLKGQYSRTELVRTICARSMDKNIVALAKQYEDFKVKTPVFQVLTNGRGKIEGYAAKIGMKEGINEQSKFQVVQRIQDPETGKSEYKYVATVKPKKGSIWDNRYNAVLEQDAGATLPYTTFTKVAGGEILPGMLLIEGKYRKVKE
ncbi:MAG: hypothetical protein IJP76_07205 [Paludibacteraceae bacterium]|nr:hypothetical protein [Paludibacteraceae bacterium]